VKFGKCSLEHVSITDFPWRENKTPQPTRLSRPAWSHAVRAPCASHRPKPPTGEEPPEVATSRRISPCSAQNPAGITPGTIEIPHGPGPSAQRRSAVGSRPMRPRRRPRRAHTLALRRGAQAARAPLLLPYKTTRAVALPSPLAIRIQGVASTRRNGTTRAKQAAKRRRPLRECALFS